jgi:hypothetical protein
MHVMKVGDMMEAKRKKGSPAQGEETKEMKRDHLKQNWRESRNGKTLSFGILALMLVASVLSNFAAFHFKEALPCNLSLYLAISNIVLFITHQSLSVYFHPETVSLATSPVPPLVPHSWRGRIGRQLMLGFEFLTNKLGVTVLCAQLGFILHLFLLSPAEGRLEMSVLDPKLGRPLPEKDYGNSCDNLSQVHYHHMDSLRGSLSLSRACVLTWLVVGGAGAALGVRLALRLLRVRALHRVHAHGGLHA